MTPKKSWKIFKNIIGIDLLSSKRKLKFTINNETVDDSKIIANEFNHFFTSIGPELAEKNYMICRPNLLCRHYC